MLQRRTNSAEARKNISTDSGQTRDESRGLLRAAGLGLFTGAADHDPSAIGTYASAGAMFGPAFLWMAPMMCAVVYLSAKLGQVSCAKKNKANRSDGLFKSK